MVSNVGTLGDKITPEQKRRALEQVLDSATFARADQLRRFLRYICEQEIAGRADAISEYAIATEAMGRPRDYSPGDDSSVRSRAFALRQKLEEFYASEQPAAPLRIELRKGSYVPLFTDVVNSPPEKIVPVQAPVAAPSKSRTVPMAILAGAAIVSVALVVAFALGSRTHFDPALREAWGPLLEHRSEVTICIGSPPAMLLKSFKQGTLPVVPHLMQTPPEVGAWYSGLRMMDGGGELYMQTTMNTFLVGDTLAAVRAARFLSASNADVHVLPEWGVRPLALRGRNLLLIGSPNYSPYAARILRGTPFSVRYDPVKREEVIADGAPEAGGVHVFRPKRDEFGDLSQVYGLLTVLPSNGSPDGRQRTVVFSGITSAGPQAAMEFFSSEPSMRDLQARFARDGYSNLPPAYQVVVRCGVDRALALTSMYEAHRAIKQVPSFD